MNSLEALELLRNGLYLHDDIDQKRCDKAKEIIQKDIEKLQAIESADLGRARKNFNIIYDIAGEYADLVGLNRSDTINCNKERVDNFFKKSKLLESKERKLKSLFSEYLMYDGSWRKSDHKIASRLQKEIQALLGFESNE